MRTWAAILTILFAAALLFAADATQPPQYTAFGVQDSFTGAPVAPKLTTKFQRGFRSQIMSQAKAKPDFAGHYHIVSWGCGTECVQFAIVDSASGAVFDPPFQTVAWGGKARFRVTEGIHYRTDSRLLTIAGCPNEERSKCGTYYFEWDGAQLKELSRIAAGQ